MKSTLRVEKSCLIRPFTIFLVFCSYLSQAQTSVFKIKKDTITFSLQEAIGFGPDGSNNMGVAEKSFSDSTVFKLYPKVDHIPSNLTEVKEFVYVLDNFQFFYQNYVSGLLSKGAFFSKSKSWGFNLADTINLSRKPILCYISALTGKDKGKNEMYVIDANNNNDYADDTIRFLSKSLYLEDQIVSLSVPVRVSYYSKPNIKEIHLPIFLSLAYNPKDPTISFYIPKFSYRRFSYNNVSFLLCAAHEYSSTPFVSILADRPYFNPLSASKRTKVGEFVEIGDNDFKVISIGKGNNEVKLVGNVKGFSANEKTIIPVAKQQKPKTSTKITSISLDYTAPIIKGLNFNSATQGSYISTANLKGKYIFVDFWGAFCAPCIQELPEIKEAYTKFGRDKFEIIGVYDERGFKQTAALFSSNQVSWPNIKFEAKDTDFSGYGHIESFPTSYLIDPAGKIIAINLRGKELIAKLNQVIGFD